MILFDNLDSIRRDVRGTGRDITLIAATKTQNAETVKEFVSAAPEFILGENRVQELLEKYNPAYRWHFIGRLQTNKVKYIIDKVELIHSLDRDDLAREINKQAAKYKKIQPCLIEVNMGGEQSKGGVLPEETETFIKSLEFYKNIRIDGLMSVLPNLGDTPELHNLYDKLYDLYLKVSKIKQNNVEIKFLSAGMTNDYKIALAHGANMIRLGRVLFGERIYTSKDTGNSEEK